MSFYTNVAVRGNNILLREILSDGTKVKTKIPYQPSHFVQSAFNSKYQDIHGNPVEKIKFESISKAREWLKSMDEHGLGMEDYKYAFISDEYRGDIDFDSSKLHRCNIDIETECDDGFPDPQEARKAITAITIIFRKKTFVFGTGDYKVHKSGVYYKKFDSEHAMLDAFMKFWIQADFDVITGWNTRYFDIPYLYNRITNLLGVKVANKMSPWGIVLDRTSKDDYGREQYYKQIVGISDLDYLILYKKFTFVNQETYKLDYIAHVELGEGKLDYSEHGNLHLLYLEDYQKYIEYNIRDVELVERLDEKLGLLDLAYSVAYDSKVNYEDTFGQVKLWDIIIFNALREQDVVVPHKAFRRSQPFAGAFVKEPKPGMYKWIVSFDLNSLYPHIIMQWNMSPETLIEKLEGITPTGILNDTCSIDHIPEGISIAANGSVYNNQHRGILPQLMQRMYDDRKVYQKKMRELKQEYEKTNDPDTKMKVDRFHNLQLAKKIILNSAYGSISNNFFRYFDLRIAEGITLSGQLAIQWAERKMNQFLNEQVGTEDVDYVIAVDTDSLYLNMENVAETMSGDITEELDKYAENVIQPYIEEFYQELSDKLQCYEQKMVMGREIISDIGFWTGKKRYALNVRDDEGVRLKEPKLKIMGLETKRSSTPYFFREALRVAIEKILREDNDSVIQYSDDVYAEMKNQKYWDISFPKSVNDIEKYDNPNGWSKGTPIQVKSAIIFNRLLEQHGVQNLYEKIKSGDKLKYSFLTKPNPIHQETVGYITHIPEEFDLLKYLDYDKHFEKGFFSPLKSMLNAVGWKTENKGSLEDWF
jgi:DNA polymerase elongation subunit (family B)